jgi:hypothetical protein
LVTISYFQAKIDSGSSLAYGIRGRSNEAEKPQMTLFETHLTSLLGLVLLLASCGTSSQTGFDASQWRMAPPGERRVMAKEFLKEYRTKALLVDDVKALLGDPDYEDDNWCYGIGASDSDSSEISSTRRVPRDLELCVSFKNGTVGDVGTTYTIKLTDDAKFNSTQWKASKPSGRIKMARNLIESELLLNKTKDEVRQILGEAERKSDKFEIGYDLGLRVIDHVYLVFVVGPDRKILDAKIEEH